MAIFGTLGGVVYLLLGYDQIIPLIKNCRAAACGIMFLTVGVMSYLFWRLKAGIVKIVSETCGSFEEMNEGMTALVKDIESKGRQEKTNGQPSPAGDSQPARRGSRTPEE